METATGNENAATRVFDHEKMQSQARSLDGLHSKYKLKCCTQFEEQVEEGFAWQTRRPRAPLSGNLFCAIVAVFMIGGRSAEGKWKL